MKELLNNLFKTTPRTWQDSKKYKTFEDVKDGDIIYKYVYPENYIIPIKVSKVRTFFKSHLEVEVLEDDPDYPNNKKGVLTFNRDDSSFMNYFVDINTIRRELNKTIKELSALEKTLEKYE